LEEHQQVTPRNGRYTAEQLAVREEAADDQLERIRGVSRPTSASFTASLSGASREIA
jgi:hypothetical protein